MSDTRAETFDQPPHAGDAPAATYHLRVLGAAMLLPAAPPGAEPVLGPGKSLALLVYLALAPRRTASREQLIDLLWSDAEPESARRNLRQALHQVRRRLGPDSLAGDEDDVTLTTELSSDRDRFLRAAEADEMARAVALYTGPFFPAFASPGGALFEQWADLERRRLHAIYLHALDSLTRDALRQRRWREAIANARRLRDAEPESETGWRLLLEALISDGEWIPAAIEAEACEAMLGEQGRMPEPALRALLRAARQAPPSADPQGTGRLYAELVGREAEFSAILRAWDEARRGRLQRLHLLGTAGVGKSRLLREAAARFTAGEGRVVLVRANQGERDLAWALAGDLVRALGGLPGAGAVSTGSAGILLGLDPSLSARFPAARATAATGDELLRMRTVALAELVAAVADESPLALMVDDLHWADGFSRRALLGLSSRAGTSPVLLLTSSRSGTDGPLSEKPEDSIMLRPLTEEQVGELVESIAALPDSPGESQLVPALHHATGGNPLLVTEALQTALDRGWLVRDAEGWRAPGLPQFLHDLEQGSPLARRIEVVPPDERRLLLALAKSGRPLADELVAAMPAALLPGAEHALDKLEGRGLAVRGEGGRELAHDLLADPIIAAASDEDRKAVNEGLGVAMHATARGEPGRLLAAGRHLARAGAVTALRAAFTDYVRTRRGLNDRSSVRALAAEFIGPTGDERLAPGLVRGLPLRLKWAASRIAAGVAVAGLAGLTAGAAWLSQPAELRLAQAARFVTGDGPDRPIIVEILDRAGRISSSDGDSLRVTLVDTVEGVLTGHTAVRVRHGRATFDSIQAVSKTTARTGWARLRFTRKGLTALDADSVVVSGRATRLWLDSARLNGQRLTPSGRAVTIRPGERVRGPAYLRYTSLPGGQTVMLAVVPTWGDRRKVPVGRSLFVGKIGERTAINLDLPGPARTGRYRIVLAAMFETEARFVASATNWLFGEPRWFDGNDLADMTGEQARTLDAQGWIEWPWLMARSVVVSDSEFPDVTADAARVMGRIPKADEFTGMNGLVGTTIEVVVE